MLAQVLLPMLNQIALSAVDIEKALSLEALDMLVSRKMLLSRKSLWVTVHFRLLETESPLK
jgi:hypothetical protein